MLPVSQPPSVIIKSELAIGREPTGSASPDSKAYAAHRATAVIGIMAVVSARVLYRCRRGYIFSSSRTPRPLPTPRRNLALALRPLLPLGLLPPLRRSSARTPRLPLPLGHSSVRNHLCWIHLFLAEDGSSTLTCGRRPPPPKGTTSLTPRRYSPPSLPPPLLSP